MRRRETVKRENVVIPVRLRMDCVWITTAGLALSLDVYLWLWTSLMVPGTGHGDRVS